MRKAVDGTRQLTYKCGESLVSALVALLAACRNTGEDHIPNLAPELPYKFPCNNPSHLGLIATILEIKDSLSVEYAIYTHILDASWIVAEETAQFLVLLPLDENLDHVHCRSVLFLSLSFNPFGL